METARGLMSARPVASSLGPCSRSGAKISMPPNDGCSLYPSTMRTASSGNRITGLQNARLNWGLASSGADSPECRPS
jgi:hypothetical protein